MAMTARTSVVQGFFSTFVPRQTIRMPIPPMLDDTFIANLNMVGGRIFQADAELTAGDDALDALRNGIGSIPLRNRLQLIEGGIISRPSDVSWPSPDADWSRAAVSVEGNIIRFISEDDQTQPIPAPTLTGVPCEVTVVDADLRSWVTWEAWELIGAGKLPDRNWLQNLSIPDDFERAAMLIQRRCNKIALNDLKSAVAELDKMVSDALGLSPEQLMYILRAFETDALLQHVNPQWRHRA
jgi:hypothetical protein